jgi:3-phenylpropionate/trans-cinnamate dioxygenase ferredoxin reductase component
MQSVVVVGASLAGLRAIEELRDAGYGGTIVAIGDEPRLPYDRPPLSKQVLAGEWDEDRTPLTVAVEGGLDGLEVNWRLGTRATGLDLWNRLVATDDGERLNFKGLVIATGARPRTLGNLRTRGGGRGRGSGSGEDGESPALPGVHTLRTIDDCMAIRAGLDANPRRVVVVGAGFIGAEVAATCRARGLDVTLIEALPVPLERAVGRQMGVLMAEIHRDHGVDLRFGVGVKRFEGAGRVERVVLDDGSVVDADLVVVGVGVTPNTEWLNGSRLRVEDGVVCDENLMAAPGVVAAGDVARWPSARYGASVRVEHWENAVTMGAHAARSLLTYGTGRSGDGVPMLAEGEPPEPFDPVPWFWSDQYDRKIQLAGLVGDADEVAVVDGSLADRRFVAIYRNEDRIVGVLTMNRPRQMVTYRRLVENRASWEEALAQP